MDFMLCHVHFQYAHIWLTSGTGMLQWLGCRTTDHMASSLGGLQLATVVACVGWMGVSSGLIMVNKYLMSTDGFHYPMALSCLGMLFSSVASYFACRVSVPAWPCHDSSPPMNASFRSLSPFFALFCHVH